MGLTATFTVLLCALDLILCLLLNVDIVKHEHVLDNSHLLRIAVDGESAQSVLLLQALDLRVLVDDVLEQAEC